MKTEIIELESILNQEMEAYGKLEQYIIDKKESLVKGDIEKLMFIDAEIEKFSRTAGNLETKRIEVSYKFSEENLSLKEIIERIEKEEETQNLTSLRLKLKKIVESIEKHNKINARLIENSLKIIEFSVNSIAKVFIPEISAYDNHGKARKISNTSGVSSVVHDI